LPEAEPLHAEKVVYAVVQDEEEPAFFSLELVIFSLLILFVGIAIGRYTAPGAHTTVMQAVAEKVSSAAIHSLQ
jgi:hypothetical protein